MNTSNKHKKIFEFKSFKEASDFAKVWANELFTVKLRKTAELFEVEILTNESTKSYDPALEQKELSISDEQKVKELNNKINARDIKKHTSIFLKCIKCNHEKSAFLHLRDAERLDKSSKGIIPNLYDVKKILPTLICPTCKSSLLLIALKDSYSSSRPASFVATSNSKGSVFHISKCSWLINVPLSSSIVFTSRDEAIKLGFKPCKSCKP